MWKILAGLAVALLAGSAYVGYLNRDYYQSEVGKYDVAQAELEKKTAQLIATQEKLDTTNNTIANVESEISTLETNLKTTIAKTSEVDLKDKELSDELEGMLDQIAKLDEIKAKMGDIEEFKADLAGKNAELASVEQSILSAQNALNIANDRIKSQQGTIADYTELQRTQQSGIMRHPIRIPVREVYGQYGFVVLGAGDNSGIVPRAKLVVTRGGVNICTLTVSSVDPSSSVASIDPGSLAEGEVVLAGDIVLAIKPDSVKVASQN
jgi:septal ring factor EnvC (AmiA/AmiB activator)